MKHDERHRNLPVVLVRHSDHASVRNIGVIQKMTFEFCGSDWTSLRYWTSAYRQVWAGTYLGNP